MGEKLNNDIWDYILQDVRTETRSDVRQYLLNTHTSVLEASFINNSHALPVTGIATTSKSMSRIIVSRYISAVRFKDEKLTRVAVWKERGWSFALGVFLTVLAFILHMFFQ